MERESTFFFPPFPSPPISQMAPPINDLKAGSRGRHRPELFPPLPVLEMESPPSPPPRPHSLTPRSSSGSETAHLSSHPAGVIESSLHPSFSLKIRPPPSPCGHSVDIVPFLMGSLFLMGCPPLFSLPNIELSEDRGVRRCPFLSMANIN